MANIYSVYPQFHFPSAVPALIERDHSAIWRQVLAPISIQHCSINTTHTTPREDNRIAIFQHQHQSASISIPHCENHSIVAHYSISARMHATNFNAPDIDIETPLRSTIPSSLLLYISVTAISIYPRLFVSDFILFCLHACEFSSDTSVDEMRYDYMCALPVHSILLTPFNISCHISILARLLFDMIMGYWCSKEGDLIGLDRKSRVQLCLVDFPARAILLGVLLV